MEVIGTISGKIAIQATLPPPPLPSPLDFLLHDYESADAPREQFAPYGFFPRTYRDTHNPSLPETTKRNSFYFPMTLPWCQLEYELIKHFAPAHILTDPPKNILQEDALKGYVVKSRLEEIYLRINHGKVYKTNGQGWNDDGFYDPLTGAGDSSNPLAKPYKRETLTCCGNIVWNAGYGKAWAVDALATPPTVEQLIGRPWLLHASTACYGRDPQDRIEMPRPGAPNGTWRVDPFGDLEGNIVPILFVSADPGLPTLEYEGLHLRQAFTETSRTERVTTAPPIYVPDRPLRPKI